MRSLIAIVAFAGKEIRHVVRQPKLVAALILGPFIILGLFAAGFNPSPPDLRSIIVADPDSEFRDDVERLASEVDGQVDIVEVTDDEDTARQRLEDGDVDLVVVTPGDVMDTLADGEHARITVFHNRLDPFEQAAVRVAARQAVDELNRTILSEVAAVSQDRSAEVDEVLPEARRASASLSEAIRNGDPEEERAARTRLERSLGTLENGANPGRVDPRGTDRISNVRSILDDMESGPEGAEDAERLEAELAALESDLDLLRSIPPDILVQPFVAETELVDSTEVPLTSYYSPAVMVVLLQHVVLTFAALSVVQERQVGATDLFRVGPVRTAELLAGKFGGYAALGVVIALVLVGLLVGGFSTPMVGDWGWLAAVLALTMAASLGLGFVIAATAKTDVEAVQYSMLALLFTIFMSGLVVSLTRLTDGVRELAFLAPATAGTVALQDVMFRGQPPRGSMLVILSVYAVVAMSVAYAALRKRKVA